MGPRSRVRATEDLKISFYFLVHAFGFPVSLRVIGSGESKFITEEFAQFFGESCYAVCVIRSLAAHTQV